jgi:hypothetical protein
MASVTNVVHHPSDVWFFGMVGPGVMPMDESLRNSDLGDEGDDEEEERVHCDRPAMDGTGEEKSKSREGGR